MPNAWARDLENLDVNSDPQSNVTCDGTPCFENIWEMNRVARVVESRVLVVGVKIACLVSLSTTTKMSEYPSEDGNCSMKSIEMESQGQRGTGSCFRRP